MKKIITLSKSLKRWDLFVAVIILLLSYFYFFRNLGGTSLNAWDEAWYAGIAKEMINSKNPMLLYFNKVPFWDHPPVGMALIAVSYKIFGISELTTRLAPALSATGSLFLVYLIAKRFNRYVGLGAVLILASFSWFWLRARQADLDLILIFFLLASYYLSLLCKKDKRFLILFSIVTALMLQVKTIIGLFLLPVLMLNLIESKALKDKKILFMSIFMFIFLTVFWYGYNFYHYGFAFIRQNIFNIGLRMSEKSIPFLKSFNLSKTSEYLQYSLLKWYKPVVISFFISYFFFTNKILRNLHYWIYPFLIAFLFGPEPGIWHLMPIYPPLAIIASCVLYKIIAFFVKIIKIDNLFRPLFLLTFISFLFVLNTYHLYDDIVLRKGESNEAFLSKMASRLNGTLFIQDDYWPVAVFYSGRKTIRIVEPDKKYYSIKAVFENSERPFQILAKRNDFNDMDKYKVIVQKEDRVLVGVE